MNIQRSLLAIAFLFLMSVSSGWAADKAYFWVKAEDKDEDLVVISQVASVSFNEGTPIYGVKASISILYSKWLKDKYPNRTFTYLVVSHALDKEDGTEDASEAVIGFQDRGYRVLLAREFSFPRTYPFEDK